MNGDHTAKPGEARTPAWTIGVVLAATVLAAVLPYALKLGADRDLWWHVRTGQLILEESRLPETDPFSFTAPQASWTNHEWLSDVVLGGIYSVAGGEGLSLWRVLMLVAVVGLLAVALRMRFSHPVVLLAALLLTMPLIRIFINLRPHGFTYLFTILLVVIFDRAVERPRVLWCIPPMMVLWANLHGGFLLGLAMAVAGLVIYASGMEHPAGQPTRHDLRRCLAVGGLTLAAPALNPHGLALFPYLVRELGAEHTLILEWYGIWSFPEYRVSFVLLLLVPLFAVGASLTLRPPVGTGNLLSGLLPRRMALPLVMLGVGAFATWRHGRFLVLPVLFSCLVTFAALPGILEYLSRRRRLAILERLASPRWLLVLVGIPLLAGLAQFGVDYRRKGLHLEIVGVPVHAAEFLMRHDLGPNLVLRLDWGGYAIWHLFPEYKVSADGRNLTVYDEGFVTGQLQAYDRGEFAQYFQGYDVDAILIESAGPAYRELRGDDGWLQVYEDSMAAVFVQPEIGRSLPARVRTDAEIQPAAERFYFP